MTIVFSILPQDNGFAITAQNTIMQTPAKRPLILPTDSLAQAVAEEWAANAKFNAAKMPLTALAYTAIDRIEGQSSSIVDALLVYIDTDTLSYRASGSEALARQQDKEWGAILAWLAQRLDAAWQVTAGVMPIEQPQALHWAIGKYLRAQSVMRLAAACVLASGCSSLALALAVLEKHIDAGEAFRLSRLEEDAQAEQWGRDDEAEARAARLKQEILAAGEFLRLLDAA